MMYKNMLRTPNQLRHVDLSFINITMYIKSTQHLKEIISITLIENNLPKTIPNIKKIIKDMI